MSRQIFLQCDAKKHGAPCPGVIRVRQSYKLSHLQVHIGKCTYCKAQHGLWKIGRMKEVQTKNQKVNGGPIE